MPLYISVCASCEACELHTPSSPLPPPPTPYRRHAATSGLAPGPPARLFCFFCSRKQTMTVLSYFVWNCPTQRRNVGTSGSRCTCHNGVQFNPNCHELWKQEKCSSLAPPRRVFYKTQWAWQSVKITRLMSIFTSKIVWKFLIKILLTNSDPKSRGGGKYPASCQLG